MIPVPCASGSGREEVETVQTSLGGRTLILETGRMAKQADGAVVARYGETTVLATTVVAKEKREGIDFLPLSVDYREKVYAAGKIPGSVFRREGRPTEKETLTARLIDRPLRPLFPSGIRNEIQIMASVISWDGQNEPDVLAVVASSASAAISGAPLRDVLGAVRVGKVGDEFVVNPTNDQLESDALSLSLVVAGTRDRVTMLEGEARQASEADVVRAIEIGHEAVRQVIDLIVELRSRAGKPRAALEVLEPDEDLVRKVAQFAGDRLNSLFGIQDKQKRNELFEQIEQETLEFFADLEADRTEEIKQALKQVQQGILKRRILEEGLREDGRCPKEIRPISCEVGVVPRVHGSALFTRGQTQALVTVTLGTDADAQSIGIDDLRESEPRSFILHYNFPPFSVGEVRPVRGPGRREIGHGALAEKALRSLVPVDTDEFPYCVRVVSDILESNGSSSMASVCGASLALMDAGVPLAKHVAGISIGLVSEGHRHVLLTDIAGLEDHLGEMDFKIAGTREGVTAMQLDVKGEGLTLELAAEALAQAKEARLSILEKMEATIPAPRADFSPYAPRVRVLYIDKEKIRDLIGPGGRVIRGIIERTGAEINVDDDGRVSIACADRAGLQQAVEEVESIVAEAQVGRLYRGPVTRLMTFGAFVEILPGKEGLVHISELSNERVGKVQDVVKVGDVIDVKVVEIDDLGRINLSKRAADEELGRIPPRPAGGGGGGEPSGGGKGGGGGSRGKKRSKRRGSKGGSGGRERR